MSLHAIANHMASKGRGPDTMLIHMAPEEVRGLQALANAHGGSLTINPDTGLPEAGFLKKLLPTIIGAGLTFISGGAINPMMAAGIVGGVETLRTGDIGRGISAGLGAYGGAGLTSNLAGAGVNAMTTAGVGNYADYAKTLAAQGLEAGTPAFGEAASQLALNAQKEALAAPFADRLSAGLGAVKDPAVAGTFLKDNAKSLMYAAGPAIMAGANVENKLPQTVTKPGMIRPFSFDPYSGTFTALTPYEATPVRAAGGGLMDMADGGYNPGDLEFAERSEPVVRMAAGGDYRSLTKDSSAADIASAYKQFTTAGGGDTEANRAAAVDYLTNLGIGQDRIGQAYTQFQAAPTYTDYTQQNVIDYLQANPNIDIAAETARLNANPLLVNQAISQMGLGFLDPTQTARGSGTLQYADVFGRAGIDANELFAANLALDPNYAFAGKTGAAGLGALQHAFDVAGTVKGFNPAGANQLAKDIEWVKMMDTEGYDATDIARATGLSIGEVQAREAAARAAMKTKPVVPPVVTTVPPVVSGDTGLAGILGGSGGGGTVLNRDGTITTRPNIPGIPAGGFTGMGQVRDIYEQGGGSLGYTPYVPTSIADFEAKYNRLTGGSKQGYDFLTGKGEYPTTPYTPTGEIQKPYWESVGRMPTDITTKRFLFQNGKYVENPDYVPPVYKEGVRATGLSSREVLKGIEQFKNAKDDVAMFDWVTENNVSEAQLAAALGISIAAARARLAAAKKKKMPDTAQGYDSGAGGDGASGGGGGAAGGADGGGGPGGAADGGSGPGDGPGTGAGWAYGGMVRRMALGGLMGMARGGSASQYNLGDYSDGGRLLRGPGDGVSDSIPASIGNKRPARLADGEFVIPARIVSELGNGSTEAGARKLYAMMDRVQKARRKTTGKKRVAVNTRADKYLPA